MLASNSSQRGFTLLEALLSVAIISMIVGISLPVYRSFQVSNDLSLSTETVAMALRRAQSYSEAVRADSQWGVMVQAGSITLFKGSSYAARDTTYDEVSTISSSVAVSGLSEVVYSKLLAAPSTTGTVTLTANTDTKTVILDAKGTITY